MVRYRHRAFIYQDLISTTYAKRNAARKREKEAKAEQEEIIGFVSDLKKKKSPDNSRAFSFAGLAARFWAIWALFILPANHRREIRIIRILERAVIDQEFGACVFE